MASCAGIEKAIQEATVTATIFLRHKLFMQLFRKMSFLALPVNARILLIQTDMFGFIDIEKQ
jgi:hypothetical protein